MDGRVPSRNTDGDLEGLDETQRAEVHEYEGGGPTDGLVLTDMARDHGEDFVEDDRRSEIMPDDEIEGLGMSIVSPEEMGELEADDDSDPEMI